MKKYIVRTPETDRFGLDVPTKLTDLTDYAAGQCSGQLERKAYHKVPNGTDYDNVFDTTISLTNAIAHAEGAQVNVAGLFLVTYSVVWFTQTTGASAGDLSPAVTLRSVTLKQNGSVIHSATTAGSANGSDGGTVLVRLAATDFLEVFAKNSDPTANSGASPSAILQFVKVAP
jgi:hypothetical protein